MFNRLHHLFVILERLMELLEQPLILLQQLNKLLLQQLVQLLILMKPQELKVPQEIVLQDIPQEQLVVLHGKV